MTVILAMSAFALAMSISPGPVNLITLSSGVNNGVLRTLPFVSGATIGFTSLLAFFGLGAVQIADNYPRLMNIVALGGALFILYLAFKIATANGQLNIEQNHKPNFLDGALLQWLNPKAWVACLSGVTAFTVKDDGASLLLFCALYFVICYFGIAFWAVVGAQAKRFIHGPTRLRIFNMSMGVCLAAVGLYLLIT
jgi:threonine/homoserine/homoserine lactone efflux protein